MGIHLIGLFFALFVQSDNAMHIAVDHTVHARVVCLPSFMVPQKQKNISRNKSRLQQSKDNGLTKSAEKQDKNNLKKTLRPAQGETEEVNSFTSSSLKTSKSNKRQKKESSVVQPSFPSHPELSRRMKKEQLHAKIKDVHESVKEQIEKQESPDEILYVNQDTYQQMEIARAVQNSIIEHWVPPLGMPNNIACQVQIIVNGQGKAADVKVLKKSGVAVFDMAARRALLQVDYPKLVWNKTIIVSFNEDFA